ncbi:MAG TPA: hypothetical protein DCL43_12405 [Chitinophagaceae bacterium]|nr:hypothetical protein [Chitinophagaceae bacterium]
MLWWQQQWYIFRFKIPAIWVVWMLIAAIAAVLETFVHGNYNNYKIFEGVFHHVRQQTNLYALYPNEYEDCNHYGPTFSLLIAPFALLPQKVGVVVWCLANAAALLYAIQRLPISNHQRIAILWIAALEMMTSIHNVQFNPMLTAMMVLAFVGVYEEKDWLATLMIALGFLIKLYGIAAILFFVFSKHKLKFIGWGLLWLVVLFAAPMLISSPEFIVQSYVDWYTELVVKNAKNANLAESGMMQDLSVMGMIRRISQWHTFPNWAAIIPGGIVLLLPLLRFKQYAATSFQLLYLAAVLLTVVIFSSSAESATYVIAVTGFAIWYTTMYQQQRWMIALLLSMFVLTELSATDLLPNYFRVNIVRAYALKALPCTIAWICIVWQLGTHNFASKIAPQHA